MASLEFSDVVKRIVEEFVRGHIYTAMPAKVIAVDKLQSEQVIDVKPQINDTFKDGKALELPPILDVPVQFPSAGGGILSFPIKVGDVVLLTFAMKSIDEWLDSRETDLTFTPKDKRSYSYADAIAIPCLYPRSTTLNPNPDDVELKFAGSSIKLRANGDVTVDAAKDIVATAAGNIDATASGNINATASGEITLTAPTIKLNGNVEITGSSLTHNGTDVGDTHTHNLNAWVNASNHAQATLPPT